MLLPQSPTPLPLCQRVGKTRQRGTSLISDIHYAKVEWLEGFIGGTCPALLNLQQGIAVMFIAENT